MVCEIRTARTDNGIQFVDVRQEPKPSLDVTVDVISSATGRGATRASYTV